MPEFHLIDHIQLGPTQCVFCSDFEGPFIDTHRDIPGYGFLYVCAPSVKRPSGCLGQMTNLVGYLNPQDRSRLEEKLEQIEGHVLDLEDTIRALEQVKEIQTFLAKREKRTYTRKPVTPVKEPA